MIARSFLLLVAAVSLSACTKYQKAEDAVKNLLNDPGSAQFSDMQEGVSSDTVCGMVNAKNRMGGYVGKTPFFYNDISGMTALVSPASESDFNSMWLSLESRFGSFEEKHSELSMKCRIIDDWKTVCGTEAPVERDRLCDSFKKSGGELYKDLKQRFD